MLLRFPALLVSGCCAFAILAIASSFGAMYKSSAANAALHEQLETVTLWEGGLTVESVAQVAGLLPISSPYQVITAENLFNGRDDSLQKALAGAPGLGPRVLTILGEARAISNLALPRRSVVVRPMTRTGELAYIERLSPGSSSGMWLPASVARALRLHAGQSVAVHRDKGRPLVMTVAGIYRDLDPNRLSPYWSPLAAWIAWPNSEQPPPSPLVLLSEDEFRDLEGKVVDHTATFEWQFPLARRDLTVEQGALLAARLERLPVTLTDPAFGYFGYWQDPSIRTQFPDLFARAEQVAASLQATVGVLSLMGVIVAFLVVLAAAAYWGQRRRSEMRQLATRGIGATATTAKTWVEVALPAVASAVVGLPLASWLVRSIGPSGMIAPSAVSVARHQALRNTAGAVAILGIAVGLGSRLTLRLGRGRLREVAAAIPWELLPLALAGATYYEIANRGTTVVATAEGTRVDKLLLLFPLLFILGGSALLVRLLRIPLGTLRRSGRGAHVSMFLALRRLSAVSATAGLLVVAASVAVGVMVYSGALQASVHRSISDKAAASIGSEVSVSVGGTSPVIPAGFPYPATLLTRAVAGADLFPTGNPVEILEIDAATFGRAAFWDRSFSPTSLAVLLRALQQPAAQGVPALVLPRRPLPAGSIWLEAGTVTQRDAVTGERRQAPGHVPLDVVSVLPAFPGASEDRTELVVDRSTLLRAWHRERVAIDLPSEVEVWSRGDPSRVEAALARAGIPVISALTATKLRSSPPFVALSWTFGFMALVGVLMIVVAMAGMALYLQARQRARELSYVLARRMGLRAQAHGVSILLEVAVLLLASGLLGTGLGVAAARLSVSRVDPMPSAAPAMSLRVPFGVVGVVAGILALASVLGAAVAQFRAGRADVGEMMRVGA